MYMSSVPRMRLYVRAQIRRAIKMVETPNKTPTAASSETRRSVSGPMTGFTGTGSMLCLLVLLAGPIRLIFSTLQNPITSGKPGIRFACFFWNANIRP